MESGRSDPRASTLQSIAKVLGVEVHDLFGEVAMPATAWIKRGGTDPGRVRTAGIIRSQGLRQRGDV
ncbi:MAG: hypothetical protein ACOYES_11380 [Bacillota bacterium]